MKHKHCFECKGCYGYHYAGCTSADPKEDYSSIEDVYLGKIAELEAQVAELEEVLNEVLKTAMGWQDEEDHCLSSCGHTEMCGNELIECLKGVLTIKAKDVE